MYALGMQCIFQLQLLPSTVSPLRAASRKQQKEEMVPRLLQSVLCATLGCAAGSSVFSESGSSMFSESAKNEEAAAALAATLGLVRITDVRFKEFVESPHEGDGLAQRRRWSSIGDCPNELLVTDSFGQIAFKGLEFVQPLECSWRIRPSMYLEGGYFRDMAAPLTLSFLELSLSPNEVIEIWAPGEISYTDNMQQLDAFQRERRSVAVGVTAATAEEVAPGSPLTEALATVAAQARADAETSNAKVANQVDRQTGVVLESRSGQSGDGSGDGNGNGNGGASGGGGTSVGSDSSREPPTDSSREPPTLHMLARYEGGKHAGADPPPPLSSLVAEVLVVYRCTPPQRAAEVWAAVRAAVDQVDLEKAVRLFEGARAARLRGFVGQDVRRVLYALAKRAAAQTPSLHARLFPRGRARVDRLGYAPSGTTSALLQYSGADALLPADWAYDAQGLNERPAALDHRSTAETQLQRSGFAALVDEAITTLAQEQRRYLARSTYDATSTWSYFADRYSPRKYPAPHRLGEPDVTPPGASLTGVELLAAQSFQGPPRGLGSVGPVARAENQTFTIEEITEPYHFDPGAVGSRWLVNFTVEADCSSILPYGEQAFPPELAAGHDKNFRGVPFPMRDSRCQPVAAQGKQTTRDRPYTISEKIMQETAESELSVCLTPPQADPCSNVLNAAAVVESRLVVTPLGGLLSQSRDDLNRLLGEVESNCTVVCPAFLGCVHASLSSGNRSAEARLRCLSSVEGKTCASRTVASFARAQRPFGARSGFEPICLKYSCFDCLVRQFELYFNCALACTRDKTAISCVDCAYNYAESHHMLLSLQDRMWEAYFLNALGETAFDDMLTADFRTCAASGQKCLGLDNYRRFAFGINDAPGYNNTGITPVLDLNGNRVCGQGLCN
jgi:uncharacterized membrane protein YgcG